MSVERLAGSPRVEQHLWGVGESRAWEEYITTSDQLDAVITQLWDYSFSLGGEQYRVERIDTQPYAEEGRVCPPGDVVTVRITVHYRAVSETHIAAVELETVPQQVSVPASGLFYQGTLEPVSSPSLFFTINVIECNILYVKKGGINPNLYTLANTVNRDYFFPPYTGLTIPPGCSLYLGVNSVRKPHTLDVPGSYTLRFQFRPVPWNMFYSPTLNAWKYITLPNGTVVTPYGSSSHTAIASGY